MIQRILIADDEPLYLRTTGELLRNEGYECVCVGDAEEALKRLEAERFDLVLSDLNMPGNTRLELLHEHSRRRQHIPLIVITGVPTLPSAIESIRLGISDYLLKPVKFETLLQSVRRAILNSSQTRAAAEWPTRPASELQSLFPTIVGNSPAILEVLEIIDRLSGTHTNILITGESGTGKEIVAKAIHNHSPRSKGPFQVIDCTAIPDTLFESMLFGHRKGAFTGAVQDQSGLLAKCDRGTAFFDELGELPLPMQAKLLRAVQEQTFMPVGSHTSIQVDTRFICATNRDLQLEVSAGRFRQDLYYRLGVIHIDLPPLRERGNDVILLAKHFLKTLLPETKPAKRFSNEALVALSAHRWPGNVRELRNVVEYCIALSRGELIELKDLPARVQDATLDSPGPPSISRAGAAGAEDGDGQRNQNFASSALSAGTSREQALHAAERQYLLELMQRHEGNVSEAARQAEVSRQGLHKRLKLHGIRPSAYRH